MSTSARIDVSVVIPTRNRWDHLQRAIRCVLGQRDVELELIVVDDGSTDRTPEELARIEDPRLMIETHPTGGSVARARNDALRLARGEWIAFLDDDDLWAPDRLRRLLDLVAATDPQAGFAVSSVAVMGEDGRLEAIDVVPDPSVLWPAMRRTNAVGSPSGVLVRRELVARAGGFDERFAVLADWDLWLRLLPRTRVVRSPEVLSAYFPHAGGMHVRSAAAAVEEFAALQRKSAAGDPPLELIDDEFMRWIGRAYRRGGRRGAAARLFLASAIEHREPADVLRIAVALLGEKTAQRLRAWLRRGGTDGVPQWVARTCDPPQSSMSVSERLSALWSSRRRRSGDSRPAPEVTIVVVTRNALRYCVGLFRSLRRTTDVRFEVVVVDNRSRLPTRLLLVALALAGRIHRLCLLDRNTLFAEGNNVGVSAASREAPLVLLLNSDVAARDPRWLRKLVDAHRRGATSLGFVDGKPIDRLDGYCFLIDRDLYLASGLDERHQWWWGITRLQADLLRAGHEARGVADHDDLLVHFGGKSGRRSFRSASGMDVTDEEVIGWFDGRRAERLDHL